MTAWKNILDNVTPEGQRFFSELDSPRQKQEDVLKEILQKNTNSQFGKQYDFQHIKSIQDFQSKIPIHSYEQLTDYIERISKGEQNVLTSEAVTVFEETGGSTTGAKLIPYTASSLFSFQKALYPWLYDLLSHHQGITHGSAYWSISPALCNEHNTQAGIPIGLVNDAEYFGATLATSILHTLAVPPMVGATNDFASWQYLTLRYLLAASDLSLISIWSPTFLIELITALIEQHETIIKDILKKEISISLPKGINEEDLLLLHVDDDRIAEIKAAFQGDRINTRLLWPKLDTISCWLDANAARYQEQLESLFPDVYLQGKGLLATEGVISIPVCNYDASVLAINSVFFEFIDKEENIYLAHELSEGETYRILITTYSGFYRYDIGDQIMVTGYLSKTPLVKFIGRTGIISDLCGEKLTEPFVLKQLQDVTGHVMLLPYSDDKSGYILLLEEAHYSHAEADQLIKIIEQSLCKNPQYAYARKIEQLAPLIPLRINNLWDRYTKHQCNAGRRLGDIKPMVLSNDVSLYKYFTNDNVTLRQEAL